MSDWSPYQLGKTLGTCGLEGDLILKDEEHPNGARITMKRGKNYLSITCNLYQWIHHSRLFISQREAEREYEEMKPAIAEVVSLLAAGDKSDVKAWEVVSDFVSRFP